MNALRQEALEIVNDIPENFLLELVENLRGLKNKFAEKNNFIEEKSADDYTFEEKVAYLESLPGIEVDPKVNSALSQIADWQKRNKEILSLGIDWEKERAKAMEEKYGSVI